MDDSPHLEPVPDERDPLLRPDALPPVDFGQIIAENERKEAAKIDLANMVLNSTKEVYEFKGAYCRVLMQYACEPGRTVHELDEVTPQTNSYIQMVRQFERLARLSNETLQVPPLGPQVQALSKPPASEEPQY
jgi:hypothetical protein